MEDKKEKHENNRRFDEKVDKEKEENTPRKDKELDP